MGIAGLLGDAKSDGNKIDGFFFGNIPVDQSEIRALSFAGSCDGKKFFLPESGQRGIFQPGGFVRVSDDLDNGAVQLDQKFLESFSSQPAGDE